MRTIIVGTTPQLLLAGNAQRARWTIQYTPSSIAAGNNAIVFVGRGFTPVATVGDANQGDVLNPGAAIEEKKQYDGDTLPYKGPIYIVASGAGQQITVDEQNIN